MIRTISRRIFLFVISAAFFCIVGVLTIFALCFFTRIPHYFLHGYIQQEFSKAFQREVTFDYLDGNLFTTVTFHHLRIADGLTAASGNIIEADEMAVQFRLYRIFRSHFDILRTIRRIDFYSPTVRIVRNRDDYWNIIHLLPPPDPHAPEFGLRGKVCFHQLLIHFRDEKGWGAHPLTVPFEQTFSTISGELNYQNLRKIPFHLQGQLLNRSSPFEVNGFLNIYNGHYDFSFRLPRLDLDHWGGYVFPVSGFRMYGHYVSVDGWMESRANVVSSQLPFDYHLVVGLSDNLCLMPFFSDPVSRLSGQLLMADGQVHFKAVRGYLSGIVGVLQGDIDLKRSEMQLQVQTESFDAGFLKRLFPVLQQYRFSGQASSQLSITGALNHPLIEGQILSPNFQFYGFNLAQFCGKYRYQNSRFDFQLVSSSLYGGQFSGKGVIDMTARETPSIDGQFTARSLVGQQIFSALPSQVSGDVDMDISLSGTYPRFALQCRMAANHFVLFDQRVQALSFNADIQATRDLRIASGVIKMNDSDQLLHFSGFIDRFTHANFSVQGQRISLDDFGDFTDLVNPTKFQVGLMTVSGNIDASLDDLFWHNPLDQIKADFNLGLTGYSVYRQYFDRLDVKFLYDRGALHLMSLFGQAGSQNVVCQGEFDHIFPVDITLSLKHFDLENSFFVQRFLPHFVQPFSGICELNARITRLSDDSRGDFFSHYFIDSNLQIDHAVIRNQAVERISILSKWNSHQLIISSANICGDVSHIFFYGALDTSQNINLHIEPGSVIDLSEFSVLTSEYGLIGGVARGKGVISGQLGHLRYQADLDIDHPQYHYILFDHLKASVDYRDHILSATSVDFVKDDDHYLGQFQLDITPFLSKLPFRWQQLSFDGDLTIKQANPDSLSTIFDNIYQEINAKMKATPVEFKEEIYHSNIQSSIDRQMDQYRVEDRSQTGSVLKIFNVASSVDRFSFISAVTKKQTDLLKPAAIGLKKIWKGVIQGEVHVGLFPYQLPVIRSDISLKNAEISFISGKEITFHTEKIAEGIQVSCQIHYGNIGGKDFSFFDSLGVLDPQFNFHILKTAILTGDRAYDNVVKGTLPLALLWDEDREAQLDLAIKLDGDNLGVLSVFNRNIANITNDGGVQLHLTGTFKQPVLNSDYFDLKNAKLYFSSNTFFRSPFCVTQNSSVVIRDNRIFIPNLRFFWKGADTTTYHLSEMRENQFLISGSINIQCLRFVQPDYLILDMDLGVEDTDLTVYLADLFHGDIKLDHCTIKGPYYVPFSAEAINTTNRIVGTYDEVGPVISANVAISNGAIAVPPFGPKQVKPSFLLNVRADILDDVYVEGSLLGEGFLSGLANTFSLKVADKSSNLVLTGSLNALKIDHVLTLESGDVNILNRTFSLFSEDKQALYYPNNPEIIGINVMSFKSELNPLTKKYILVPYLKMKAGTEVEQSVAAVDQGVGGKGQNNLISTSNLLLPDTKLYKAVVIRFNGSIYQLHSMYFDQFNLGGPPSDRARFITLEKQYVLSATSQAGDQQDTAALFQLLIPDVLLNAGSYYDDISKKGLNSEKAKELIDDIGARQINIWAKSFLRPIERRIAERVGIIDDIQLDYNVGNKILNMTSSAMNLEQSYGKNEQLLGINVIKKLSDQLVLRGVTNVDTTMQGPTKITQVELTYYLLKNFSVNYSNERAYEDDQFIPKLTIKGTYEF